MTWVIPELPVQRSPEAKRAYIQGFKAAAGLAVKYEGEDKSMAHLKQLADLMPGGIDDLPG